MNTKHTPGPWIEAAHSTHDIRICAGPPNDRYSVAVVEGRIFRGSPDPKLATSEGLANARLIAAAPDLLAACQAALRLYGSDAEGANGCASPEELAIDLRAAIAKAGGGA